MEHEFVPGKRRCRKCGVRSGYALRIGDTDCGTFPPPAPEPEPPPQVWHLNVWTDINGVIFTGQKAISQPEADALSWRFRLMEEGKGPAITAAEPLDGVETALVNSLIQQIAEIRSNKPTEETE